MTVENPLFGIPRVYTRPVELGSRGLDAWITLRDRTQKTAVLRPDIPDYVGLPWINGKEPGDIDRNSQAEAAAVVLSAFQDTTPNIILGIGNSGLQFAEEVVNQYRRSHPNPSRVGYGRITNQERLVSSTPKKGTLFTAHSYSRRRPVSFHIPEITPGSKALVIDDVSAQGSIASALIKELIELGVDVVGFGVYFNKDWQGGLVKVTHETGVPSFSVIRIEKKTNDGIVLLPPEKALTRIEKTVLKPEIAPIYSDFRYPTDDIQN